MDIVAFIWECDDISFSSIKDTAKLFPESMKKEKQLLDVLIIRLLANCETF